jgi:hypothetical protein
VDGQPPALSKNQQRKQKEAQQKEKEKQDQVMGEANGFIL